MNSVVKIKTNFVLLYYIFKKIHPSWKPKDIAKFPIQSEKPPSYTTKNALWLKILRIFKRNQVDDLLRSGAPRTTATIECIRCVNHALRLKEGASIGNVNAKLRQEEFKTSNTSVRRAKSSLNLKWWKQRKVQKLTTQQ